MESAAKSEMPSARAAVARARCCGPWSGALADRVIVLDEGRVALDIAVEHPRPRRRGAADLAQLEGQLLKAIFA